MSDLARRFLRAPRRGVEIRLGADGRVQSDADARVAALATAEVTDDAASIVDLAQARAHEIVREAALGAAAVQQEAYAEGLTAGRLEGAASARAELLHAIILVQRVAGEAKAMRDQLVAQAEREIVELVIAATQSVIGDRIATDAELVHETVRRALARAGSQNVMRVRVSPDEQERVVVRLAEERGAVTPFEVLADGSVRVGGCVVDTQAGRVDARLDVQLDEIAALLSNAIPARLHEWGDERGDADAR